MENTKSNTFAGSAAKDTQKDNRFSPRSIDAQDAKFDDSAAQQSSKAQPFQSSAKSQSGASAPSMGSARGSETTGSSSEAGKKSNKSLQGAAEDGTEGSEPTAPGRGAGRSITTRPPSPDAEGPSKHEVSASAQPEWMSDISEKAEGFNTQFKSFVVQRPLVIMGAALAVGYLANRFMISRDSSRSNPGV